MSNRTIMVIYIICVTSCTTFTAWVTKSPWALVGLMFLGVKIRNGEDKVGPDG